MEHSTLVYLVTGVLMFAAAFCAARADDLDYTCDHRYGLYTLILGLSAGMMVALSIRVAFS